MAHIQVDTETLRRLAKESRGTAGRLRAVARRLVGEVREMEWEARHRLGVEDRVQLALARLESRVEQLERMARYLDRQAEAFVRADMTGTGVTLGQSFMRSVQHLVPLMLPGIGMVEVGVDPTVMERLQGLGRVLSPVAGAAALVQLPPLPHFTLLSMVRKELREHFPNWDPYNALAGQRGPLLGLVGLAGLLRGGSHTMRDLGNGWSAGRFEWDRSSIRASGVAYDKKFSRGSFGLRFFHAEASASGPRGDISRENGGKVSADPPGTFMSAGAKVAVVHAEASADLLKAGPLEARWNGNVDALGGEASVKAGPDGFEAEAMAYVVHGETDLEFTVFDWKVKLGVEGCLWCVGGGVDVGAEGGFKLAGVIGGGVFWDIAPAA